MNRRRKWRSARAIGSALRVGFPVLVLLGTARCDKSAGPTGPRGDGDVVLRLGVSSGQAAAANPQSGLMQITRNLSVESLARLGEDGRLQPQLAESWVIAPDGLSAVIRLRPGVRFSDGSPLVAGPVADLLNTTLKDTMGPAFEDVDRISALDDSQISIRFRRPSPFLLESLEVAVRKPGTRDVGTGPFMLGESPDELRANEAYYQGRPKIDRITLHPYPTVRAAWAEMLRDRLDMLYEVGVDALDSMRSATNVSVYTFNRRYQYEVVFNTNTPSLRSPAIRRALNLAIDRDALIRSALNGHGVPSSGIVWPRHWTLNANRAGFRYEPTTAATILSSILEAKGENATTKLRFTCLVPADWERLALVLKQQLDAVGVDMALQSETPDEIFKAYASGNFEAILGDVISGQSLFRPYRWWHTRGSLNPGKLGSPALDAALDRVRHAASDDEYRAAVAALQEHIVDDPPAIFLAWSERARAVSRRFDVPPTEPGRDILATLPFWKLSASQRQAAIRPH